VGKLIFWIVIVFAVLFALRLWNATRINAARRDRTDTTGVPPVVGKMVRCVDCGVFLPQSDAGSMSEGYRCGDAACPNRKNASR
jgi:hypothetical protein